MLKPLLTFITIVFFASGAYAQTTDTIVTYLKHEGTVVNDLDSADYIRFITRPKGQTLFDVNEYYKTGKPRLIGKSSSSTDKFSLGLIAFEGPCISFFPDGKRKSIENYKSGAKTGESTEYYPSGKIYCIKKYYSDPEPVYLTCYDSTGKQTAEKGDGHWIMYGADFKYIVMEGEVKSGYKNGEWKGRITDSTSKKYVTSYSIVFRNNFIMWSAA